MDISYARAAKSRPYQITFFCALIQLGYRDLEAANKFIEKYGGETYDNWPLQFQNFVNTTCERHKHVFCVCRQSKRVREHVQTFKEEKKRLRKSASKIRFNENVINIPNSPFSFSSHSSLTRQIAEYTIPDVKYLDILNIETIKTLIFTNGERTNNIFARIFNNTTEKLVVIDRRDNPFRLIDVMDSFKKEVKQTLLDHSNDYELVKCLNWLIYHLNKDNIERDRSFDITNYVKVIMEEFRNVRMSLYKNEFTLGKDITQILINVWPTRMIELYREHFPPEHYTTSNCLFLFRILLAGTSENVREEAAEMCRMQAYEYRRETISYKSMAFIKICGLLTHKNL